MIIQIENIKSFSLKKEEFGIRNGYDYPEFQEFPIFSLNRVIHNRS